MQVICYHGTKAEAAVAIQQKGFRPWTHFARHLENAIDYGGLHVFDVVFDDPPENWQFHNRETVSPNRITRYRVFQETTVFENKELQEAVFQEALKQGGDDDD